MNTVEYYMQEFPTLIKRMQESINSKPLNLEKLQSELDSASKIYGKFAEDSEGRDNEFEFLAPFIEEYAQLMALATEKLTCHDLKMHN